jgi:flagellum-specific ATP synthase
MTVNFDKEVEKINQWSGLRVSGIVNQIIGLLIESIGPYVHLGELCYIYNKQNEAVPCEVVGFKDNKVLLMSLGDMTQLAPGSEVYPTGKIPMVGVSESLCGRVLDALGNPIDDKGPLIIEKYYPVMSSAPNPMKRKLINNVFSTGIKAIDTTCTTGQGQRVGIFSGAGVGKSTLLGMIAKMSQADINVIALIGERGREVREFIEKELGPHGLARSVVVVVTSDQAALLRTKGAYTATAIAEYFRDMGKNVVFMMDSITRYAMALREIGLAVGEPPTTRGYTPSVFAMLPKLLERTGNFSQGVITGIYTILVEADDMNDPVADTVRAILDGHIVLSRKLATANQYPAIDVLNSLSRLMLSVTTSEQNARSSRLRDILQVYKEAEDFINIGAYVAGSNPKVDEAIALNNRIRSFLKQGTDQYFTFEEAERLLKEIVG